MYFEELRIKKGFVHARQLARASRVNVDTITQLDNCRGNPTLKTIALLAKALDVDTGEMATRLAQDLGLLDLD